MNERQKQILRILLEKTSDYLSSQQIANRLACSEKTVRNDSKQLDEWLRNHSTARLTRKPNIGFCLEVSEKERNVLLKTLSSTMSGKQDLEEGSRLLRILEWVLIEKKQFTLQKCSEALYVNKVVVKKDLDKIENFLHKFNLSLVARKKLGIEIEGEEQNYRLALSKIPEFLGDQSISRMQLLEDWFQEQEIQAVKKWLEDMNKNVSNPYTDETIQNLLMHVLIAVKRLKLGNPIELPKHEIELVKKKKEFSIADQFMKKLGNYFSIHFPINETAYIALHFMGGKVQNVKMSNETDIDSEVKWLLDHLIHRISTMTHIDFTEDLDFFAGLSVHLQSTFNRLKHRLRVSNPILEDIKRMYPYMFHTIITELVQFNKELSYEIPEAEAAYITLHFQASLERLQKKNGKNKRAIIVCPMGIGASVLLRTKIERKFHSLKIVDSVSMSNIKKYTKDDIDFIITTIPISYPGMPIIEVSPLLTETEQNILKLFIENHDRVQSNNPADGSFPNLRDFFKNELILFNLQFTHRFEVIESLATKLYEQGFVTRDYIESTIIRERHSSTSIGGGVAIPHGDPSFIKKSTIAVGVLKKPIQWGKDYVSLVLLLATKQEEYAKTKELFTEIGILCENPLLINTLIKHKNAVDFINSF